ncbi:MvaI/BcnI restriction endonuclease family protein [Rhizobium rhizogenes]|uniref:MvaI/BcnI restriction endonuclease family protein n=1 Tax=Rhizobium rhizogenes TaxID=359 RepID=A0AA94VAH8_RHIRH|nr:MvaI/BcnI family restriction endonuclease [Rhizobium rhizogenes]TRA85854.1 MvaI/BcnI restriction endonuclease family protein [Rhizobium rhizogenes]
MPLRQLTEREKQHIERLTASSIDIALLQPTLTGLKKSILDATISVRNFFRERGVHDYDCQGLGATEYGEQRHAILLDEAGMRASRASLYRPKTKQGDPRLWFSGLPSFAEPDDMLAILIHDATLYVVNLTRTDVSRVIGERIAGPLLDLVDSMSRDATTIADELLKKLRAVAARGLVASVMSERADTAVGRTLEHVLGIQINSRKEPDYKGIELKSYRRAIRASRENRKTLFAQVPNWTLSKFKSSREILENFGYERGDDFKLYCTVSTKAKNSQGLYFEIADKYGLLNERSTNNDIGAFASWALRDLRASLAEKHNETFWVGARVYERDGHDHFEFRDVIHTRRPILSQFDLLLEQGEITMDHLIKKTATGRVSEKGPLFKINAASLGLLFPPSKSYALL